MLSALRHTARRLALPRSRSLHITAHTIEHPTPEVIASLVSPRATVFFSLSTSIPAESISALIAALPPSNAGSFHIADVPTATLAILQAEEGEYLSTFSDSTEGRAPIQVGKWQRLGTSWSDDVRGAEMGELERVVGKGGWEDVWRGEESGAELALDDRTRAVLAFTDSTPQTLISGLAEYDATTLGLVSAPTPFLTGRNNTLIHNGSAHSTGSVGVALSAAPKAAEVVYGIEPLDVEYVVERARGNLLLAMEGAPNPTQTLIAALQSRDAGRPKGEGLTKDEDFWLSIRDTSGRAPRIVRILSGDPSRGTLSVDTDATLAPGQVVQFLHRPKAPPPILPLSSCLRFATLPRAQEFAEPPPAGETRVMPGFLAASEDGFIYGAAGTQPTVCNVTGASVTARWWS